MKFEDALEKSRNSEVKLRSFDRAGRSVWLYIKKEGEKFKARQLTQGIQQGRIKKDLRKFIENPSNFTAWVPASYPIT
jgi:hypothetical protein